MAYYNWRLVACAMYGRLRRAVVGDRLVHGIRPEPPGRNGEFEGRKVRPVSHGIVISI